MKKITRLTYNSNGWFKPCGHPWKQSNQGKGNIAYENQYGYGHEEWLFNPSFQLDGYQYGYIRGLTLKTVTHFDEVHLYTIKKEKGKSLVYYVGYLRNVENIMFNEHIQEEVAPLVYDDYFGEILTEVESINGDTSHLLERGYYEPGVRFKVSDMHLESELVLLPNFDLSRYMRFMPYNLDGEFLDQIKKTKKSKNGFNPGKAKQSLKHSRSTSSKETTVTRLHSKIVNALEVYLKPEFGIRKKNISIEKCYFNGGIGDIVTQAPDISFDIYEVKTTFNARRNIREALSQLLDYSVHSAEKVNHLYIVSPAALDEEAKRMLKRLNKLIKLPISYLYYDMATDKIK